MGTVWIGLEKVVTYVDEEEENPNYDDDLSFQRPTRMVRSRKERTEVHIFNRDPRIVPGLTYKFEEVYETEVVDVNELYRSVNGGHGI